LGSSIAISARRNASARPIGGSFVSSSTAPITSLQCDTKTERAPT
jgi:ParB-like chromosome segregation protein Spo0J